MKSLLLALVSFASFSQVAQARLYDYDCTDDTGLVVQFTSLRGAEGRQVATGVRLKFEGEHIKNWSLEAETNPNVHFGLDFTEGAAAGVLSLKVLRHSPTPFDHEEVELSLFILTGEEFAGPTEPQYGTRLANGVMFLNTKRDQVDNHDPVVRPQMTQVMCRTMFGGRPEL